MAPNVEGYFSINYWDSMFKGYMDEFYIYDTCLSEEQVVSLFIAGDVNVQSEPPVYDPNPVDAIDTVVRPDLYGWTLTYVVTADIAPGNACWFFPIVDCSYIEVLSVV